MAVYKSGPVYHWLVQRSMYMAGTKDRVYGWYKGPCIYGWYKGPCSIGFWAYKEPLYMAQYQSGCHCQYCFVYWTVLYELVLDMHCQVACSQL